MFPLEHNMYFKTNVKPESVRTNSDVESLEISLGSLPHTVVKKIPYEYHRQQIL